MPHVTVAALPDPSALWTEFVLARSVRDLAGVLDAVGGAGRGDAYVAAPPVRPYVEELRSPTLRLRVGLLTRDVSAGMPVDPECVAAVERTGTLLASMGHDVEDTHPPALDGVYARVGSRFTAAITVGRYMELRWLAEVAGRELTQDDLDQPIVTANDAAKVSALEYVQAGEAFESMARELRTWWDDGHDLLVTPTCRQPAWPLGSNGGARDAGTFPGAYSFSGQPVMSLPLHWTPEGLPVGVQLVAAYGREDLLF